MATAKLSEFVTRLGHRLPEPSEPATDAELLARYLKDRNEEAFTLIVRRHGPLVFGVCRRVTGQHHLAEDAFQAVFVVLAAKAGSIRPQAALPAWLYGVAYRVALRARTMSDRRRRREQPIAIAPDLPAPASDPLDSSDCVAMLDAEIARLPEHQRLAVLACEIEGKSRQEVAAQLLIPEGTLSSRLAAARKVLAERLRRRGVVLSAAGLTAAFTQVASATVPTALTSRAVALAMSPAIAPTSVTALSQGVLRAMFAEKLRLVPLSLAILASAVLVASFLYASEPQEPPRPDTERSFVLIEPPPVVARPAAEKPQPKTPNKLLFYRAGHLTLLDPDGKNEQKVSQDRGKFHPGDARLSSDGKMIAVLIQAERVGDEPPRRKLYVRGLGEKEPGTDLGVECQLFIGSTDGTEIAYSQFVDGPSKKLSATHGIVKVKTKETSVLKLPENHILTDWSRDGKFFLTTSVDGPPSPAKLPTARLYLMNRDGSERKALTDANGYCAGGRLSPDGTRVLFMEMETKGDDKAPPTLERGKPKVLDIATGKSSVVQDTPLNGDIQAYCWSPDGKRIAYAWRERHAGKPEDVVDKETESFLVVCDPDGKNAKTIATEKAQGQWTITIGHIDWR